MCILSRYAGSSYRSNYLWLFRGVNLCAWIVGCLLAGAIGVFFKVLFFSETAENTDRLRGEFRSLYNISMEEIVYNGPLLRVRLIKWGYGR